MRMVGTNLRGQSSQHEHGQGLEKAITIFELGAQVSDERDERFSEPQSRNKWCKEHLQILQDIVYTFLSKKESDPLRLTRQWGQSYATESLFQTTTDILLKSKTTEMQRVFYDF